MKKNNVNSNIMEVMRMLIRKDEVRAREVKSSGKGKFYGAWVQGKGTLFVCVRTSEPMTIRFTDKVYQDCVIGYLEPREPYPESLDYVRTPIPEGYKGVIIVKKDDIHKIGKEDIEGVKVVKGKKVADKDLPR